MLAVVVAVTLSACAPSAPVIEPVVEHAGDLDGTSVALVVGQTLDIDTGSLAVDSYIGKVDDTKVAEFVAGRTDGGTTFDPAVKALAVGTTQVVLSNTDGGIEDVSFTVTVTTAG